MFFIIIICFLVIKDIYNTNDKTWLAKDNFWLSQKTGLWESTEDIGSLFIIHYYLECKKITKGIQPGFVTYEKKRKEETMMLDKIKQNFFVYNTN